MEIILTINWLPGCARPAPWRKFSADSTTQIRGCSDPFSFLFFFVKPSSCYSLLHIFPTSSSKGAPKVAVSQHVQVKSSSRYSPVRFLSTTFPDQCLHSWKRRPYFGDPRSHITRKNTGFRARECFHLWIHMLPNCCTSQLLDDAWLAWWCGWHNDVLDMMVWMLTMTIVRNSEVFQLNFLWSLW